MMKTLIVTVAALVLAASAAFAECDYHKVNAAADVDRSMTTASIPSDEREDEVVLLRKTDRMPEETVAAE